MDPLPSSQVDSADHQAREFDRAQVKRVLHRVAAHDAARLRTAYARLNAQGRQLLASLPLLFHFNQASLPGYIKSSPAGIAGFVPTRADKRRLQRLAPAFNPRKSVSADNNIDAIYLMGSTGSVAHSHRSDIDFWVCTTAENQAAIQAKIDRLSEWAARRGVELQGFAVHPEQFSGNSAQQTSMLLLDEFYRSACCLAGKPLMWWIVPPGQDYHTTTQHLLAHKFIKATGFIDFGPPRPISNVDMQAALTRTAYECLSSPDKGILKLALLVAYQRGGEPLADRLKRSIAGGDKQPWDVYVALIRYLHEHLADTPVWPTLFEAWQRKAVVPNNQARPQLSKAPDFARCMSRNRALISSISSLLEMARSAGGEIPRPAVTSTGTDLKFRQALSFCQTHRSFVLPALRPGSYAGCQLTFAKGLWHITEPRGEGYQHTHLAGVVVWALNHQLEPGLDQLTSYQANQVRAAFKHLQNTRIDSHTVLLNLATDVMAPQIRPALGQLDNVFSYGPDETCLIEDLVLISVQRYPAPVGRIYTLSQYDQLEDALDRLLSIELFPTDQASAFSCYTCNLLGNDAVADAFAASLASFSRQLNMHGHCDVVINARPVRLQRTPGLSGPENSSSQVA